MVFLYGASFEGLREGGPGCKARFYSIFRAGGYSGQLAKLRPELSHGADLVVGMMVGLQGTQIRADDYYLSTTIEAGYLLIATLSKYLSPTCMNFSFLLAPYVFLNSSALETPFI